MAHEKVRQRQQEGRGECTAAFLFSWGADSIPRIDLGENDSLRQSRRSGCPFDLQAFGWGARTSWKTFTDAIPEQIKTVLSEAQEVLAGEVSPEQAGNVKRLLGEPMSAGSTEGGRDLLLDLQRVVEATLGIIQTLLTQLAAGRQLAAI